MQVILSYGMGVESTAILTRWILEPETRPCPLSELLVITAMTGDEYADSGRDVERFILPLMREHSIRYVQLARHGHLENEGITILEDSTRPQRLFLDGDYRLSDELRRAGTLPQFGGEHRCALKFKAYPIELWLKQNQTGPARHAFGYNADEPQRAEKCTAADAKRMAFGFNADEQSRIDRTAKYDSSTRESFFPLLEWGWTRQDCLDYLTSAFGVTWNKSACTFCPFNALKPEAIERHRQHPEQIADAMTLELVSLAMNPRGTLYPNKSLIQITLASGDQSTARAYRERLDSSAWSLYRVRRIYHPGKTNGHSDQDKKGMADRAVEQLSTLPTREDAERQLDRLAADLGGDIETQRELRYLYQERKGASYPAREEFYTVAPAHVQTKARYGIARFDAQWDTPQGDLFPS